MWRERIKRTTTAALALGLTVIMGHELWIGMQMDKLGVVIYVTPEVMKKGAVVSVLTRKVPAAEFETRYPAPDTPPDIPGAPKAERQWHGTVTGPVDMVFFEIPDDGSYTYRFRAVPVDGEAAATVLESVLSIGGTSYDVDGRDMNYVEFGLNRAHEIVSLPANRAWISEPSYYEDDQLICTEGVGVRVCSPTEDGLQARAVYLTHTTPSIEGRSPWAP